MMCWYGLKQEAHLIKGGSANLIADDLSKAAKALEDIGKTNNFTDSTRAFEAFEAFEKEYLRLKNFTMPSKK